MGVPIPPLPDRLGVSRQRDLLAYQTQCAICRLRHAEPLEAAHILPDDHPKGEPIVPIGLAICTLHHAAFDRHILGVRPDLVVEVRHDILREPDGPMLKHRLQRFQGSQIAVLRIAWGPAESSWKLDLCCSSGLIDALPALPAFGTQRMHVLCERWPALTSASWAIRGWPSTSAS